MTGELCGHENCPVWKRYAQAISAEQRLAELWERACQHRREAAALWQEHLEEIAEEAA